MDIFTLFPLLFPAIFFLFIPLAIWSWVEQSRFSRFEGPLKRGVTIWAESLSWETRNFLESLFESQRYGNGFIRVEGRELLIGEERSMWASMSRRNQMPYVGYVSLSAPESRLEFRTPISTLISTALSFLIFLFILVGFTGVFSGSGISLFGFILPLVFLLIFAGSLWFNHRRRRGRVLEILDQAMRTANR